MLVANGLYAKEAAAMVETWRDSWFEDGLRLFYIVPRAAIDDVLPLEVTPAPASTARVFVGRIELITPAIVAEVKKAVLARERAPIVKYGRFLKPILARIAASSTAAETALIQQNVSFAYATAAPAPPGATGSRPDARRHRRSRRGVTWGQAVNRECDGGGGGWTR